MPTLADLLQSKGIDPKLPAADARTVAAAIAKASGLDVCPDSIVGADGAVLALATSGFEKRLLAMAHEPSHPVLRQFAGQQRPIDLDGRTATLRICPTSAANAAALRKVLPYTAPTLIGLRTSVGLGDRLGLATPGHVKAVEGTGLAPFFAQQSIREMTRTQRTAQQVMDDASWGVFQAGWRDAFGSDADHLKTTQDIDSTAAAGFTMFTIDPSEHVDNAAGRDPLPVLREKLKRLPWGDLDTTAEACRKAYLASAPTIAGIGPWRTDEEQLLRAACKYGRAIAHTVRLARYLDKVKGQGRYELEMSVDETDSPTTPVEHFFVANELARLGVKFVSLAPRFIGDFEKGIDYKGDLAEFERQFAQHAAIARHLGPYKISIHSGSDKFSIYPIAAKYARGLVHLKTAGTSYLEATRVIARNDPAFFRELLAFALDRYDEDKRSYHVSADPRRIPPQNRLPDKDLEALLDDDHSRQLLHVTFGSVLTTKNPDGSYKYRDRVLEDLRRFEADYQTAVAHHLGRHIQPFATR